MEKAAPIKQDIVMIIIVVMPYSVVVRRHIG